MGAVREPMCDMGAAPQGRSGGGPCLIGVRRCRVSVGVCRAVIGKGAHSADEFVLERHK